MQITTRTEYTIRALSELLQEPQKPISVREICERQNLPLKYIEQLFRKLKQQQLIVSVPGAKGGYQLAICPSDITLYMVMKAVEENAVHSFCDKKTEEFCTGTPCALKGIWNEINQHIIGYLDAITLESIINKIKESSHGEKENLS